MITTTYTCDRCNKQKEARKDLYEIKLTATNGEYQYSRQSEQIFESAVLPRQWCTECCVETGFFSWKHREAQPPAKPPMLEEMIREIMAEEIQSSKP